MTPTKTPPLAHFTPAPQSPPIPSDLRLLQKGYDEGAAELKEHLTTAMLNLLALGNDKIAEVIKMSTQLALIHDIAGYKDVDEAMCKLWQAVLKLGSAVCQQGVRDVEVDGSETVDMPHSMQAAILLVNEHKRNDSLVEYLELMKRVVEEIRNIEGQGMPKPMGEFVSELYDEEKKKMETEERLKAENVEILKGNVRRLKRRLKKTRQRIRRREKIVSEGSARKV